MEILLERVRGQREEVLSYLADVLLQKGIVKEGYKESILEREKRFPTGLYVNENVKVAIPHTDIAFAKKNALVVAEPLDQISFFRMDNPDEAIRVDMVFLLVVNDPQGYTEFLGKFTEKLTDQGFIKLIRSRDLDGLVKFIKENVLT